LETRSGIIGLSLPAVLGLSVLGDTFWLAGCWRRTPHGECRGPISSGRLGDRLPVENAAYEFGRLATITNRSLDRLHENAGPSAPLHGRCLARDCARP
jgi:hypothetical protein